VLYCGFAETDQTSGNASLKLRIVRSLLPSSAAMEAEERMLSAKTYCPCAVGALAATLLLLPCAAWAADLEEKAPPAAWPTSPFLGAVDGVTGVPIPWLCRSAGSVYRLGDTVCMSTHLGVQMARCDLLLNNTSWVPIGVPCAIGSGR
jgi:hypothetical protein